MEFTRFTCVAAGAAFHHVGLVVESIEGLSPQARIFEDPLQKVRLYAPLGDVDRPERSASE